MAVRKKIDYVVLEQPLTDILQGIANGMFSHLMGQKHRQRFAEAIHPDDLGPYLDMSQGELLRLARKHAENSDDLNLKIRSRRSDEVKLFQVE